MVDVAADGQQQFLHYVAGIGVLQAMLPQQSGKLRARKGLRTQPTPRGPRSPEPQQQARPGGRSEGHVAGSYLSNNGKPRMLHENVHAKSGVRIAAIAPIARTHTTIITTARHGETMPARGTPPPAPSARQNGRDRRRLHPAAFSQ